MAHPVLSREKQGDSYDYIYGSKSEKKESARTSVKAMTVCVCSSADSDPLNSDSSYRTHGY